MLEERNQCCSNRYDLAWTHIHVINIRRRRKRELVLVTNRDECLDQLAILVELGVRLSHDKLTLLYRRQVMNIRRNPTVLDATVRSLEEAILVSTSINRQRVDQADIRPFRCLDRTNAPIVRRMHVAHLKTRTLTRQAARPKRRHATFVRNF